MVEAKMPVQFPSPGEDRPLLVPSPESYDEVIHDQGNITTTVDNFGYIGGWSYYGFPSGEYPSGSGRNYIAEICYWMGAVTSEGDTLVVNTWEDCQGMPSLISGEAENRILFSTDTTRYYNYDPTDTVGVGNGSPANGWRVWNPATEQWDYEQNYSPALPGFYDGGPVSVQESHYRFTDDASGSSLMGLEMTHTVLQWDYCYNEDFLFVIVEITNTNADIDYDNFAFGLYVDMDIGGYDDYGENGRLGDLVGSDSTENLAWTYDEDGYDPGWGSRVTTGFMGTKYLETPDDIGMTAFRTGEWEDLPGEDGGRFEVINSAQYDETLEPYDQYYVQCTRGIDLVAGHTVRVVFAIVAGDDENDFHANASLAQDLYDNHFVGPEPPNVPTLYTSARDEKVYLYWNDTARYSIDPLSGESDFSGYKLYKSENRGITWGVEDEDVDNTCLTIDYIPIASWSVDEPTHPIPCTYIDTGLINGVEYWYCLVAFDAGASDVGIDILQNPFSSSDAAPNVVIATPRTDPAGTFEAAGTVAHTYNGTDEPSEGTVVATAYDRSQLQDGDYQVVFEDALDDTYYHLINVTTGDTLLANQTFTSDDPEMFNLVQGMRVAVNNVDREPESIGQTELGGADTNLVLYEWWGPALPALTGDTADVFSDALYRPNYELRYTGQTTVAPDILDGFYGPSPAFSVPFEVWNTSSNERVSLAVYDYVGNGIWDSYDPLIIVNYAYNETQDLTDLAFPYYYGWMFELDEYVYNPTVGDVFSIDGPQMNGPDDVFEFSVVSDNVNDARAAAEMANIKVVPNPYYAHAGHNWEDDQGEIHLEFQNLPDECTVRIYTLAGDLVKTLEHYSNEGGTERWDLLSEGQRLVASGMYFYHVESRYGDRTGRFAVVK